MGLALCVRPGGDSTVVSVSGDVDICTASPLAEVLLRTMRERGPRLLLDLSGVSFMDCAGLRAIMTTRRRAELRGGSVRLIAVSAAVRRIVDLAGARDSFPVHDPVSLALARGRGRTGAAWSTTIRSASIFSAERTRTPRPGDVARRGGGQGDVYDESDPESAGAAGARPMMHVRCSQLTADPQVLAGCVRYIERSVRPVLASLHGSLGLSLLGRAESGAAIFESFWARHDAAYLSAETEARCRGELARRIGRPVTAEDYQVPVFEREGPLAGGEAARLTRIEVKPAGVQDVIGVFGDTAVPQLAEAPGFRGALLFAAPASGRLISQTVWRDAQSRSASPDVAEMIRAEVLAETHCEIRAVEDYALVFSSARKPSVPA